MSLSRTGQSLWCRKDKDENSLYWRERERERDLHCTGGSAPAVGVDMVTTAQAWTSRSAFARAARRRHLQAPASAMSAPRPHAYGDGGRGARDGTGEGRMPIGGPEHVPPGSHGQVVAAAAAEQLARPPVDWSLLQVGQTGGCWARRILKRERRVQLRTLCRQPQFRERWTLNWEIH
eukprot:350928-Chlamydomonas_euryale.AAC.6